MSDIIDANEDSKRQSPEINQIEDKEILLLNDSDLINKEPNEEGRRIASPPPEKNGSNLDNLSDNEKRMNVSPKSGSEQQLKFISTKNLKSGQKKLVDKRGSTRNSNIPTLLKNQTSLNEDLIIPEDQKNVVSPSSKPIGQQSKGFQLQSKTKSGMHSKEVFEVQEDNHQKSANDVFGQTKETVKRPNEDSLMNIKDSGFRLLDEGQSLATMNQSGDKFQKKIDLKEQLTEQTEQKPQKTSPSPTSRSQIDSTIQGLDASDINTRIPLDKTPQGQNLGIALKMGQLKQSLESGSDGIDSPPGFRKRFKNDSPNQSSIEASQQQFQQQIQIQHLLPAQVRITSKHAQKRHDVQAGSFNFQSPKQFELQGGFQEAMQQSQFRAINISPSLQTQVISPTRLQELIGGDSFRQRSPAQIERMRELKKVTREYDISKNVGIAKKTASINLKAHQLLGEAAKSQQKWMYDFSDQNPLIISSMPTEIPKIKNVKLDTLPGTRTNADGQTQISASKFKIDMPGSSKAQDKVPIDEQASFFDPNDAKQEQTFQRYTTTQDDRSISPNSPNPGEASAQFAIEEAQKSKQENNMDQTLKKPKLNHVDNTLVSTVEDLHEIISPQNETVKPLVQEANIKQSGTASGSRQNTRNRRPVASNLSKNSKQSYKDVLKEQNKDIQNVTQIPVNETLAVKKILTIQQSNQKLIDASEPGDPSGHNLNKDQFVLKDTNYETQKLQFDSFNDKSEIQKPQDTFKEFSVIGSSALKSVNQASVRRSSAGRNSQQNYNADLTFSNPAKIPQVKPQKGYNEQKTVSGSIQLQVEGQSSHQIKDDLNMMEEGKKSILGEILGFVNPTKSIGQTSRKANRRSTNGGISPLNHRHSIMSKISKLEQGTGLDSMMINASKMKFYGKGQRDIDDSSIGQTELNKSKFGQTSPYGNQAFKQDKGHGVRMGTLMSQPDENKSSMESIVPKPKPALRSMNAEINPRLGNRSMHRQALLKNKADLMRKHKNQAGIVNSITDVLSQNKKLKKRQAQDKALKTVYLNDSHGFWQEKKTGYEDEVEVQRTRIMMHENTLVIESQNQKSVERIKELPEIHFNESLQGNYKFFGSRKLPELDKILIREYDSQLGDLSMVQDSLCDSTVQSNFEMGANSIFGTINQTDRQDLSLEQSTNPGTTIGRSRHDKLTVIGLRQAMRTESTNRNAMYNQGKKAQIDLHQAFLKTQFQGIAPSTAKNFNKMRNSKKLDAPIWGPAREIATGHQTDRSKKWMEFDPIHGLRPVTISPKPIIGLHIPQVNYEFAKQMQQNSRNPELPYHDSIKNQTSQTFNKMRDVVSQRNSQNNSHIEVDTPLDILTPLPQGTLYLNQQQMVSTLKRPVDLPKLPHQHSNNRKSIELKNGKKTYNEEQNTLQITKRETLGLVQPTENPSGNQSSILAVGDASQKDQPKIITQDQQGVQQDNQPTEQTENNENNISKSIENTQNPSPKQTRSKKRNPPLIKGQRPGQLKFQTKDLNLVSMNSPFYGNQLQTQKVIPNQPKPLGFIHQNQIFTGAGPLLSHNTMFMKNQVRNRKKYEKLVQLNKIKKPILLPISRQSEPEQVILIQAERNNVSCGINMGIPFMQSDENQDIATAKEIETMDVGMSGPISPFAETTQVVSYPSPQKKSIRSSEMSNSKVTPNNVQSKAPLSPGLMMTGVYKIQSESKLSPDKQQQELKDKETKDKNQAHLKQTVYQVMTENEI